MHPLALPLLLAGQAHASRVALDLCTWSDVVVVGTIASQEAKRRETSNDHGVYRTTELRVERVLQGPPLETIAFIVEGGSLDGVSGFVGGEMKGGVGARYLLFLTSPSRSGVATRIGRRAVDPEAPLPPELQLRQAWDSACAAHPEGIPPVGPHPSRPPRTALWVLNGAASSPVDLDSLSPSLSAVLPLEPCTARSPALTPANPLDGLCLRGHEDEPFDGWP